MLYYPTSTELTIFWSQFGILIREFSYLTTRALFSSSDCSGKRPLEGPVKEELEKALARAETFTQEYNNLLKRFEEKMFNTSSVLDLFNKQFGWVSSLANHTKNEDGFFKIQAVGPTYVIQNNCNLLLCTSLNPQLFVYR